SGSTELSRFFVCVLSPDPARTLVRQMGKLRRAGALQKLLPFARLAVDQRANLFQLRVVDLGRFKQMLQDRRRRSAEDAVDDVLQDVAAGLLLAIDRLVDVAASVFLALEIAFVGHD